MERKTLSAFWIEDQLDDFIDGGWEVLKEELKKLGFELEGARPDEAKTVEQAERRLDDFSKPDARHPDIILLDLMLPQDARDAEQKKVDLDAGYLIWFEIRELKRWPLLAGIPIIVITARGRPEYMDQMCAEAALTGWLPKPTAPANVAKCTAELVHRAEKRRTEAATAHPPAGVSASQSGAGR